ncbi:MAG TPA: hypothetical protein VEF53_20615 [Patescibacteria group bacterium]|nr:hypothetical protein [Patescibacteria group bacterium]
MQLSKIKITFIFVLVLALSMTFTSAEYSDSKDGWKGYGLYNINASKFTIISEDVNVKLVNDRLIYNGEFLIKNQSNSVVKAVLGIPVQGIDKITLMEKNSVIKWKKRSFGSMQNEFAMENRVPKEEFWYVYSISLNPGETKLLNLSLEAVQLQEEQGSYTFTYYNDRKLGFSNQVEKTSLYIDISDFQPYNILSVQGIDPALLGAKGDIVLKTATDSTNTVSIKYMDVTKAALKKLQTSALYKPREIALTFSEKNYSKTSSLCDEYLKNPIDAGVSQEEIMFIKAESMRRLQNYDKYLAIVDTLDYSKLYPLELKNKILMDRMTIYIEQHNNSKLLNLYDELEQGTSESTQILKAWIENSSIYGASLLNKDNLTEVIQQEENAEEEKISELEQWYNQAMEFKYTPLIIFVAGLLLGLFLRMFRFKKKRKKSMYIYRM